MRIEYTERKLRCKADERHLYSSPGASMITLISNVGQLISPSGRGAVFGEAMSEVKVLRGVRLLLRDGRIEKIGPDLSAHGADLELDAAGGVVIPAFIDPHRHAAHPLVARKEGGQEPSCPTRAAGGARPAGSLERNLRRGFRRAVGDGVATLEVKCGQDGTLDEALDSLAAAARASEESPVRLIKTLLLDSAEARGTARDDRISDVIGRVIPSVRRRRSGLFCDVACGADGFTAREGETILRAARSAGLTPKVHALGQDTDEAALLAASVGATSIDHLAGCGPRPMRELRRTGGVCVLLPGSALLFDEPYPDARAMIRGGLSVALGTDYGFSGCGLESMWMAFAVAVRKMRMGVEEALTACTLNAAAALGLADVIGSAEPGKSADLSILDVEDISELSGVLGASPVLHTIVGGRVAAS